MKLEDYLKALKTCPDERLKSDFGITYDWPIFLHAEADEVIRHLQESDYRIVSELKYDETTRTTLYFNPGTVDVMVLNKIPIFFATGGGVNATREMQEHFERQIRDFNVSLTLSYLQLFSNDKSGKFGDVQQGGKELRGVSWPRAIAMTIDNIGRYALEERIPLCFPWSSPRSDNETLKDTRWMFSRIIYYYPDK